VIEMTPIVENSAGDCWNSDDRGLEDVGDPGPETNDDHAPQYVTAEHCSQRAVARPVASQPDGDAGHCSQSDGVAVKFSVIAAAEANKRVVSFIVVSPGFVWSKA
jgi:hypothetical protein